MSAADLLILGLVCGGAVIGGIILATYLDIRAERMAAKFWLDNMPGATNGHDPKGDLFLLATGLSKDYWDNDGE